MLRNLFQRWIGHYPTYGIMLPSTDRGGMPSVTPLNALYYTPVYRACSLIAQDTAVSYTHLTLPTKRIV